MSNSVQDPSATEAANTADTQMGTPLEKGKGRAAEQDPMDEDDDDDEEEEDVSLSH